jgi:hypothetical protein
VKRSKLETYLAALSTGALLTWDESVGIAKATLYRELKKATSAGLVYLHQGQYRKALDRELL